MWRKACARTRSGAAARFGRFGGLSYFDWYKLPPKQFDALKCDFSRKIWKCEKIVVSLHRVSRKACTGSLPGTRLSPLE